jgi:phosphate-selective porin OprO/OprP
MARIVTGIVLFVAVLGFVFAGFAQADQLDAKIDAAVAKAMKGKDTDFKAYWKNGLNFKSGDGNFKMKIGGRIQLDYWFFDDDDIEAAGGGTWNSGWRFRRARLFVDGTIYKHVYFKAQYDFAGANGANGDREIAFKDVYMRLQGLHECWGCLFPDIYIGHFKEFFSLEELTSSKYITFMERALPVLAFAPSRNTGFGLFRSLWGERITLGAGLWGHNTDDSGDGFWAADGRDGGTDVTGRVTFLPWAPCDCPQRFLEIGVSGSYQFDIEQLRYRVRPEVCIGDRIANTGTFDAEEALLIGAEFAFGFDRWHVQGEWIGAQITSEAENDPMFSGWYVEASYMLNGPTRPFKRSFATFDKVTPCKNFLAKDCCGPGAFELAARYSYLDLNDQAILGNEVSDITVGLNWYLNPNTAIKLNYVMAYSDLADEYLNAFGVRFQVWF